MSDPVRDPVGTQPRILVFSTITISDPGIDLAGSRHLDYPSTVQTLAVPCSSGIKPSWLVHAFERGFDGVFIASDGEECSYRGDCAERTAALVTQAQDLMRERGLDPRRLKMAAVCSVCAEPFVAYMREFSEALQQLSPVTPAA
ncbi:MAG: hydrogenase iron-sulfur subunit [Candidatus Nanopelagicales bacterium]